MIYTVLKGNDYNNNALNNLELKLCTFYDNIRKRMTFKFTMLVH